MTTIFISILILTLMEIVLGIDNIIFIGIMANGLKDKRQANIARRTGLAIALGVRIIALMFISYLAHLTDPVFSITTDANFIHPVSVRDIILFAGGLFLIHKSVSEIHGLFDEQESHERKASTMAKVIMQIVLIDIVFSADSILTAIGLVDNVMIMITAVILSMLIMFLLAGKISDFIDARPSLKVLALSFLVMIGSLLVLEGAGFHMDKTYVYFAMGFAAVIEVLNSKIKMRPARKLAHKIEHGQDKLVIDSEK